MSDHSARPYLKPYREAVKKYGAGFKSTLWNSREAQQLRFDVMIDLVDFRNCVIVDAGCATGDFAARLLECDVDFKKYVGIDALPEVIQYAIQRDLAGCEFVVADFLHDLDSIRDEKPDYVCFSGSLNTLNEREARTLVGGVFAVAVKGVVFNFLSDKVSEERKKVSIAPARRFNTVEWLDWSFSLTHRVAFRQDYLDGHDATIVMKR